MPCIAGEGILSRKEKIVDTISFLYCRFSAICHRVIDWAAGDFQVEVKYENSTSAANEGEWMLYRSLPWPVYCYQARMRLCYRG